MKRCAHCYSEVQWRSSYRDWKCVGCGGVFNLPAPMDAETPEIEPTRAIISVEIPQDEKPPEQPKKGRKRSVGMGSMFSYGSRGDYLTRHKLLEADIALDESGKEYWIKDNFNAGTSERVYIPARFKNARNKIIY